jgi:ATP-dependent Clp protease ATP-binding subunit ClpC
MFERFTESARQALFFARYEVTQLGATSIETEHLLLGLTRESKGIIAQILALSHVSPNDIRKEVESRSVFRQKIATSVEIPFGAETKRVLQFAAEEADRVPFQNVAYVSYKSQRSRSMMSMCRSPDEPPPATPPSM